MLSYGNSYYKNGLYNNLFGFIDYLKLVRYHNKVYQRLNHVVVLSKEDEKNMLAFSPHTKYSLIPTGVDLQHFNFKAKTGVNKTLIFVGHYPHYPNEEAVVYFCNKIFPLIKRVVPEVKIKLVGSCPTERVLALSRISGVEIVGEVADVNPYLQEASVFVTAFKRSAGIWLPVPRLFLPAAAHAGSMPGIKKRF
jgi:glycosyltransferase involved in cell wall biosynthesis